MRVVFDTNILVSALAFPGGRGDEALRRIVAGQDSLALSRSILDELLSVLARKFAHDREVFARVAVFLSEVGEFVEPTESLAVFADEPDNRSKNRVSLVLWFNPMLENEAERKK